MFLFILAVMWLDQKVNLAVDGGDNVDIDNKVYHFQLN